MGYSNYFFLSGIGPTAYSSVPNGELGLNTTHCINFEYTIKDRTNVCLSVQKSKTGMDPGDIYYVVYNSSYQDTYTANYKEKPYKPLQIDSYNIGLGFKFFKSGTLAPIGKYKKLEFLILLNNLTYKKDAFYIYDYNSQQSAYVTIGRGDYNFNTISIAYTMGRSRVLFDRFVFDGGIRFGFVPGGVNALLNPDGDVFSEGSYSARTFNERDFKNATYTRLFRYQLVNFHLGIGFLAF